MKNSAITIGTFDGVHLGHQFLLKKLVEIATKEKLKSVVITFDPHPRSVLDPEYKPFIITPILKKKDLIKSFGVDQVVVLKFTKEIASLSPQEFVEEVLLKKFNLKHLVVGFDSAIGKGRQGEVSVLKKIGQKLGFKVTQVEELKFDKIRPSSGIIRNLIKENKIKEANELLGWDY